MIEEKKVEYTYFVAYVFKNNAQLGFGNTFLKIRQQLRSADVVREVSNRIREETLSQVYMTDLSIISFQLIETKEI